MILWYTNYECILSTQLTGNAVTNDVSITAAEAATEDGDRSVYLSRYVMCIMVTLLENGIEHTTAAVVTCTTII